MANYTFQTTLLSAEKTGYPNLIGTSLSGVAVSFLSGSNVVFATQKVVVQSLSTNDAGIVFNPINVTPAVTALSTFKLSAYPLSSVNVAGSVFTVPTQLNNSDFGIVKTDAGNFTVFPWLSTTGTVLLSTIVATKEVSTSDSRRKRHLGY